MRDVTTRVAQPPGLDEEADLRHLKAQIIISHDLTPNTAS
jgi:hypothetical protein